MASRYGRASRGSLDEGEQDGEEGLKGAATR